MYDAAELRMYRIIFEHCPQALVVVDDDGRVLLQNLRARSMDGLNLAAVFLSRDADVHAFRAKLRVGWQASGVVRVADGQGATRRLSLDGRAHGAFAVVSVRDVSVDERPASAAAPSAPPSTPSSPARTRRA